MNLPVLSTTCNLQRTAKNPTVPITNTLPTLCAEAMITEVTAFVDDDDMMLIEK